MTTHPNLKGITHEIDMAAKGLYYAIKQVERAREALHEANQLLRRKDKELARATPYSPDSQRFVLEIDRTLVFFEISGDATGAEASGLECEVFELDTVSDLAQSRFEELTGEGQANG